MTNQMKTKVKRIGIVSSVVVVLLLMTVLIGKTYAFELEDNVEVEENSTLTYYLNVNYDGIDKEKTVSSDRNTAKIKSGVIHVKDKIPDGLTFERFEVTEDGTIGAVQRADDTKACTGRVIDDTKEESVEEGTWNENDTEYTYHGLHYDKNTNTVSFNVENLQAGCVLTVGIITTTPELQSGETRRDFYNFASISEGEVSDKSNTVHTFIGKDDNLHTVTYTYDDSKPENAPDAPAAMAYATGATVGVAGDITVEGYEFLGWENKDGSVTIKDGKFEMPNSDVVLVGKFKKVEMKEFTVTYKINGDKPEDYVVPFDKTYAEGKQVIVDSLQEGDVFNGYRFSGWDTEDAEIEDGQFIMPDEDVTIVGSFEEIKYTVSYKFYDGVKPENADQYLPSSEKFKPGSKVTTKEVTEEPTGYKFLGWYKESTFTMPEEDVVIYGEWKEQLGTFTLEIKKEVINKKDIYAADDKVEFKVTITNPEEFAITKIIVKENNENAKFTEGEGYELSSEHIVTIPRLEAGESVVLNAEYMVTKEDKGTITNEVEILGALAENNYELEEKDYKAKATFKVKGKEVEEVPKANPSTFDSIIGYVVIAMISFISILGISVYVKKRNKK